MEQFSTSLFAGLLEALATGVGVVVDGVGWPLFLQIADMGGAHEY